MSTSASQGGPEPTDAEIADGQYQPYQSHPAFQPDGAGGALVPAAGVPGSPGDQLSEKERQKQEKREHELEALTGTHQFVLGIVSLGTGIPITAIAATNVEPGLLGVALAWAGIVGVNAVHHLARRRPRR